LRPTTERVREAVFSALTSMDAVDGARVLDLFAGTGAMGIEALSRGAATATFVDADETAIAMVRANLLRTGFTEQAKVVRGDAVRFVETASGAFDLVLADPPYAFADWAGLLERVPAPLAVLESDRPLEVGEGWLALQSKRYGDSVVTLVRRL
jgi:16S rRNA (guanine966-N2)-methyltransferase